MLINGIDHGDYGGGVFLIPAVNDAVKEALAEGGAVFVGVVIVPAGILAAFTTVLAIRALWRVSDPDYDG